MPSAFQDLRHGLRALASHPGLTIAAALSLGLAIGAQTSVYCLIDALFLRPPVGVTEPQRLVAISALDRGVPDEDAIRYPDYLYYRDHNTTFTELASHFNSGVALADTERAEELDAQVVSANYFSALGVSPHVGRFFLADEDVVPGRNPVVVLSHSFWQRRFGADPRCVGTVLELNGSPFTIIGVGPSGFEGVKAGWPVDVFVPNMMAQIAFPGLDMLSRNSARLDLIGQLKPGRTLEEARAEMRGLAGQLEAAHPESRDSAGLFVSSVERHSSGGSASCRAVCPVARRNRHLPARDRVCQSGGSAAGTQYDPAQGDRDAPGIGRGSRPHRPATPVRKRVALRLWGRRRAAVRVLGQRSVGQLLRH